MSDTRLIPKKTKKNTIWEKTRKRKSHIPKGHPLNLTGFLVGAAASAATKNLNRKELFMATLLHVGCGPNRKEQTTRGFNTPEWHELRLDIDPSVAPDVVGTMTDMAAVADASVDAIFSSHNLEHLEAHEVPVALKEFLRVLTGR
jgi:hypothetical protein